MDELSAQQQEEICYDRVAQEFAAMDAVKEEPSQFERWEGGARAPLVSHLGLEPFACEASKPSNAPRLERCLLRRSVEAALKLVRQ